MGYYIQTASNSGKAREIAANHLGTIVPQPPTFGDIPADKGLVVVVHNAAFEAAGFAYDADEFAAFTDPSDRRHREFVLLDRDTAETLSGYRRGR